MKRPTGVKDIAGHLKIYPRGTRYEIRYHPGLNSASVFSDTDIHLFSFIFKRPTDNELFQKRMEERYEYYSNSVLVVSKIKTYEKDRPRMRDINKMLDDISWETVREAYLSGVPIEDLDV